VNNSPFWSLKTQLIVSAHCRVHSILIPRADQDVPALVCFAIIDRVDDQVVRQLIVSPTREMESLKAMVENRCTRESSHQLEGG